jgi:hypothetical protein
MQLTVPRGRDLRRHRDDAHHRGGHAVHGLGQRVADLVRLLDHLGVEERLADDVERGAHHLFGEVDPAERAHPCDGAFGALGHHLRVALEPRGHERGRHHLALSPVEVVLAREQAVAEQRTREDREPLALHEGVRVGDEHLVRELGRAHHQHRRDADTERNEVTVFARHTMEQRDPRVAEVEQAAEQRHAGNTRDRQGGGYRRGGHGRSRQDASDGAHPQRAFIARSTGERSARRAVGTPRGRARRRARRRRRGRARSVR